MRVYELMEQLGKMPAGAEVTASTVVSAEEIMEHDAALPQPKIRRLLDRDVADPWYTGDFEATYRDVLQGCSHILSNN
jgi:protein-tyrosine-phosphatase